MPTGAVRHRTVPTDLTVLIRRNHRILALQSKWYGFGTVDSKHHVAGKDMCEGVFGVGFSKRKWYGFETVDNSHHVAGKDMCVGATR
jgi:hypothetical protein